MSNTESIIDIDLTRTNVWGPFPYTETCSVEVSSMDDDVLDNLLHAGWAIKTVTIL